jgi:hypothetical protein
MDSRKGYIEEMNRIGCELLPLICQYQSSNPMRTFSLLPYQDLPQVKIIIIFQII